MNNFIDLDVARLSESDVKVLAACCDTEVATILQLRTRRRLLELIDQHPASEPFICHELCLLREIFLPKVRYRIEHGGDPPDEWLRKHFGSV